MDTWIVLILSLVVALATIAFVFAGPGMRAATTAAHGAPHAEDAPAHREPVRASQPAPAPQPPPAPQLAPAPPVEPVRATPVLAVAPDADLPPELALADDIGLAAVAAAEEDAASSGRAADQPEDAEMVVPVAATPEPVDQPEDAEMVVPVAATPEPVEAPDAQPVSFEPDVDEPEAVCAESVMIEEGGPIDEPPAPEKLEAPVVVEPVVVEPVAKAPTVTEAAPVARTLAEELAKPTSAAPAPAAPAAPAPAPAAPAASATPEPSGLDEWRASAVAEPEVEQVWDGPFGPGSAEAGPDGGGPAGWTVKGARQTKVYLTPDVPVYEAARANVWFVDEQRALDAGFTRWELPKK